MKRNRLIALGACTAVAAALAAPALVQAQDPTSMVRTAPVALAKNALRVSGFTVSPTGKQPRSLVPTNRAGKLPARVLNLNDAIPGQRMYGTVGVEFTAASANATGGATADFPMRLPKLIRLANIGVTGGAFEDPECNGSFEKPSAPAGHLCIYPGYTEGYYSKDEAELLNIKLNGEGNLEVAPYVMSGVASRYGFRVSVTAKAAGPTKFFGTWAYTVPGGSSAE